MLKSLIFLFIFLILSAEAFTQGSGMIMGSVLDARTKEALPLANVSVLGTQRGAATDSLGNFVIEDVPVGTYRLRFSYIGYEPVLKTDVVVTTARPASISAELEEVGVEGQEISVSAGYFFEEEKVQPSTIGLSREEIRRFPGGFEDVVRTVSTLPGVAINASGGRNDLLVRGGGPSENLYVINNIEVPNINHFGTQGSSSGSLSFVNLDLVEDVTFSTGGFGAQYGDKMSSVLSLTMVKERPRAFESKLTISATQYGLDFERRITDKGNFIFSVRRSYLDLIFKAAGLPFVPIYTDFNVLLDYDFSSKDKVFLLGLSAINDVDRDQSSLENRVRNAGLLDNSQYQGIAGLNYRRLFDHGYMDVTLGSNLFRYRFSQLNEKEEEWFTSEADEHEYNLKMQHYWVISKTLGLRNGLSSKTVRVDNTTSFADTVYDRSGNRVPISALGVPQDVRRKDIVQKFAAFAELDWFAHPRLEVNTGLRADYYTFINQSFNIAPRLSIKYRLHTKHSLRASGSIYFQSPSYVWVTNPANKKLKALQNRMGILGWDFLIKDDFRLSLEGYYKRYRNLPTGTVPGVTDYIVLTNTGTGFGGREDDFQSFGYFPLTSAGSGRSHGAELFLQKKFSDIPCYGLVSFTYNKTEVTAANGTTYPGQYDQRFIFNLSGGYIFSASWEIAAKFRYFTGVPFTTVYRPSENPTNPGSIQNLPDEYLANRTKAGHHLDVRVDRCFNFRNWTLIVYLDIQNIYNYKIPQRPSYDFWEDRIIDSSDIGILPSIGISLEL